MSSTTSSMRGQSFGQTAGPDEWWKCRMRKDLEIKMGLIGLCRADLDSFIVSLNFAFSNISLLLSDEEDKLFRLPTTIRSLTHRHQINKESAVEAKRGSTVVSMEWAQCTWLCLICSTNLSLSAESCQANAKMKQEWLTRDKALNFVLKPFFGVFSCYCR